MFKTRGAEMIASVSGDKVAVANAGQERGNARSLDAAINELSGVIQSSRDLHRPLHLGNAALNLLLSVKRKGFGEAADINVIRAYSA